MPLLSNQALACKQFLLETPRVQFIRHIARLARDRPMQRYLAAIGHEQAFVIPAI